jgi:hypothetical protein
MTSPSISRSTRVARTRTTVTRATVAIAVTGALLASAACSGSSSAHKAAPKPNSTTPTLTPQKTVKPPPKPAAHNPFTGLGAVPKHPVIAVKIDDTAPGRPQRSIDKADIVYIEEVEGGLTRLAAVFGTNMPVVGYVRSTRPSDPDLLLQYGKITEAYSGGAHDSLPRVRRSGITSWSNDAGAPFYFRSPHPGDHGYINLALDLSKVARKTKTNRPKFMGFSFGTSLAGQPSTTGTDVRTTVGATPVEFRYNPKTHKYRRYIDGQPQTADDGKPVTATNVVVQSCIITPHPQDTDVNGNPAQFTTTVGSGAVSVFRGGKRVDGAWSRKSALRGTYLRTSSGHTITLAPGNTWIALVKKGTHTSS